MKKHLNLLNTVVLGLGAILFSSCASDDSSSKNKTEQTEETEGSNLKVEEISLYQCPMQCEGESVFDKAPGKCADCGMDLKKVSKK